MPVKELTKTIRVYSTADEISGDHVILRVPNPARTLAQKRDCHVVGLQLGRVIRRAVNPVKVRVVREEGYWLHELPEFGVWSAEEDFELSREYFRDHLLHYYQEYTSMKRNECTLGAWEKRQRYLDLFPIEEYLE